MINYEEKLISVVQFQRSDLYCTLQCYEITINLIIRKLKLLQITLKNY